MRRETSRRTLIVANEFAPGASGGRNPHMRCLGIDYGTRRIGLAFGDELGVATPLPALVDADSAKRWTGLIELARSRRITDVALGHPLNMDDSAGPKAREAEALAVRLRKELRVEVHLIDERLTSYEAESTIAKSKRREVRASGTIDSRAATLILQDFLNQKLPPTLAEPGDPS
ncbi:MAG: Holliday junction resolvase RuvX [Opitutus sp.]